MYPTQVLSLHRASRLLAAMLVSAALAWLLLK